MKKVISLALALMMLVTLLCVKVSAEPELITNQESYSLLPSDVGFYEKHEENANGSISIDTYGSSHVFSSTGGWPYAAFSRDADTVKYFFIDNVYLNWDFEVVSGATKILLYPMGNEMKPASMVEVGDFLSLNALIEPDTYEPEIGDTYLDLGVGRYKGSVKMSDLFTDNTSVPHISTEWSDGLFSVLSGIKVFAVDGEVVVNNISVGKDLMAPPTTTTSTTTTTRPTTSTTATSSTVVTSTTTTDMSVTTSTQATTVTTAVQSEIPVTVVTENGVRVTLTPDKASYTSDEKIALTVCATNENAFTLHQVMLDAVIPAGYEVVDGTFANGMIDTLIPGDSVTMKVVYAKAAPTTIATQAPTVTTTVAAPTVNSGASPDTDDTSLALLFAMIAVGGAVLVCMMATKNRRYSRMMSLTLVCALTLSIMATVPSMTIDASVAPITANVDVKVDGVTLTLSATVTYEAEQSITTTTTIVASTTTTAPTTAPTNAPLTKVKWTAALLASEYDSAYHWTESMGTLVDSLSLAKEQYEKYGETTLYDALTRNLGLVLAGAEIQLSRAEMCEDIVLKDDGTTFVQMLQSITAKADSLVSGTVDIKTTEGNTTFLAVYSEYTTLTNALADEYNSHYA